VLDIAKQRNDAEYELVDIAEYRAQVALSLHTDFINFSEFNPSAHL
jgi:hypothetical protein